MDKKGGKKLKPRLNKNKAKKRKLEKDPEDNEPDKKIPKEAEFLDQVQQHLNSILLAKGKKCVALAKQALALSPNMKKEDVKQLLTVLKELPEEIDLPNELTQLTTSQKPKLRKKAQTELVDIITENHEESPELVEFVVLYFSVLNQHYGSLGSILMRYLNFLANICHMLSREQLAVVFRILFIMMDKGGPSGIACGLNVLRIIYKGQNSLKASELSHHINHVYKYQPSMKNPSLIKDWFLTQDLGLDILYRLDEETSQKQVVKYFKVASRYWQIKDNEPQLQIFNSINSLSDKIIFQGQIQDKLELIFKNLEPILSGDGSSVWIHAAHFLKNIFKNVDANFFDVSKKCLEQLIILSKKENSEELQNILNQTLTIAASKFGSLLSSLQSYPSAAIFKENSSELGIFLENHVPKLKELEESSKKSDKEESLRIWSLLPEFCKEPTDINKNAKPIVSLLLNALKTQPDLTQIIFISLKNLFSSTSDEKGIPIITELSATVLDSLLNLSKAQNYVSSLDLFEAVKACFKAVAAKVHASHFKTFLAELRSLVASKDLSKNKFDTALSHVLTCLSQIHPDLFIKCIKLAKEMVESENMILKKGGYDIIEGIASSSDYFTTNNLEDLNEILIAKKLEPSLRVIVYKTLLSIIKQMKTRDEELVKKILHKAVLGTKDAKNESREAAFKIITEIGSSHIRWKVKETSGECLKEFISLILPGLMEDSFQTSATLLTLALIICELKNKLPKDIILLVLHNSSLLLSSKCEEILHASLSLIKSIVSSHSKEMLQQYLDTLIANLLLIYNSKNRELRAVAKSLLVRLIKMFSLKKVEELVTVEQEAILKQLLEKKVRNNEEDEE